MMHRISFAVATAGLFILIMLAAFSGCSDNKTIPTLPGAHPPKWMDTTSIDFHGNIVRAYGFASCATCHGADWRGGKVGVSCVDCHEHATGACTICHGGKDNTSGAPPYSVRGDSGTTVIGVGAHTAHISGDTLSTGIRCASCHDVPVFVADPKHMEQPTDTIAEIVWHDFADGGGAIWRRETRTCARTYCHGNFPGGDSANAPVWTAPDQALCGSCHDTGANPSTLLWKHGFHVAGINLTCAACHAAVVDTSLQIIERALHINGIVDTLTQDTAVCAECHRPNATICTYCHGGTDNQTGAPPQGLHGDTAAGQLAVGAHSSHMEAGYVANAFACSECHTVPATVASPGHYAPDSIAEITWGTLAGSASVWNRGTATCRQTYCHGNFSGGYTTNAPVWTASNQMPCGSCHDAGTSPGDLRGRHAKHVQEEDFACNQCHTQTVDAQLNIIGKSRHVDGRRDVNFLSGQGTYSNGSCSGLGNGCHGLESWYGN